MSESHSPSLPPIFTTLSAPVPPQIFTTKAPADVRISNMSLLLRLIQAEEGHSRATLTTRTGLAKATVSTLVGDLLERGLVAEDGQTLSGGVGRPRTALRVRAGALTAIGLDISASALRATVMDLAGHVVAQHEQRIAAHRLPPQETIAQAAQLIACCIRRAVDQGSSVQTVAIAQTGVIDASSGTVRFSTPLHWCDVALRALFTQQLEQQLGGAYPMPRLLIDNDAKCAAWAAYHSYALQDVHHLLYLSSGEGIGAGIIADRRILRGWLGETGEVGHMPVDPHGLRCRCGRLGCWETRVGLASMTGLYPPLDPIHDALLSPWDRGELLRERYDGGDQELRFRLHDVTDALIRGLSILVDVLNPQVIVLSGWLCSFEDLVIPPISQALQARKLDAQADVRVEMSTLGPWAASLGASYAALAPVLEDPTTITASDRPAQS